MWVAGSRTFFEICSAQPAKSCCRIEKAAHYDIVSVDFLCSLGKFDLLSSKAVSIQLGSLNISSQT